MKRRCGQRHYYRVVMPTGSTFETWFTTNLPNAQKNVWPPKYLAAPFTESAATLAWDLHVQLSTRIATQDLPLHSGEEKSALDSLYKLFEQTRGALQKQGPTNGELTSIVLHVLNEKVRPVTAYWHGVVGDGAFVHADEAGNFRADLLGLQLELRLLADFLGYAARGVAYHDARIVKEPSSPVARYSPPPLEAVTGAPFLKDLTVAELTSIKARRAALQVAAPDDDFAGVALSGGGIRSATFSLGVLTALSRVGLYRQLDYLSTVSGGGYVGTLLSTWAKAVARPLEEKSTPEEQAASIKRLQDGPFVNDATTEHLRDRSRYLVEDGFAGLARAALPIALGILAAAAALMLTSAVTLPLVWAGATIFESLSAHAGVCGFVAALFIIVAAVTTRIPATRVLAIDLSVKVLLAACLLLLPRAAVLAVDALQAQLASALPKLAQLIEPRALLGAVPAILTGIGSVLKKRATTLRVALLVLAASPLVAYVIGLSWLASSVGAPHLPRLALEDPCDFWYAGLLATLCILYLIDVNEHSPLGFYRDRLVSAYCVDVANDAIVSDVRPPSMNELTTLSPIHLVNATINLPASRARNDRGRGAANAVFSRHGWTYPHEKQGRLETTHAPPPTDLNIGLAMAISGAAVAPMMGTMTPSGATPWLTLLNLRLNAWLPTPGRSSWWIPSGAFLLLELLGKVGVNGHRLNASDGGHFENLGVYELIRRRCKYIIAIDGEADPDLACGGLMNLIQLARVDFGADIQINPRGLKLNAERFSQTHLLFGKIKYADGGEGNLLYLKLSVTGDEPAHLLAYRAREPVFPHHSTADQVFSEEQFECYRALGQHLGESLFRTELVGSLAANAQRRSTDPSADAVNLGEWFEHIDSALNRRTTS